jgi:predicted O-methyltransferase YrrM
MVHMTPEQWTAVDDYLTGLVVRPDEVLDSAQRVGDAAGLPPIAVAPNHGKLLHLLARLQGARSILEVGTLAGYSTIWLARALPPDGRLITLEVDERHAAVAGANLERASLADRAEIRVGRALDILPTLGADAPFDLVFVDADKENNPDYFLWALRLSREGSLIIIDNVVRRGAIALAEPDNDDPAVQATRRVLELIAAEPRVSATVIQTVGVKGYDGLAIALVTADPAS